MKYIYLIIIIQLLSACGSHNAIYIPGSAGHSSLISTLEADNCQEGGVLFLLGLDTNDDLVLQSSEVQSSNTICNGTHGEDGDDAPPTSFTPVALIDPCGDTPELHDEIFIQLANGLLIASFSENTNGKNTRFSVLTPGTYQTTDGDSCIFTVDITNQITYENHHY